MRTGAGQSQRNAILLYLAANMLFWISLYLYVPTLPTVVENRRHSLVLNANRSSTVAENARQSTGRTKFVATTKCVKLKSFPLTNRLLGNS